MPHTLLLADDSVTIQRVIELTFAEEDVDVVAVSDGDQAIKRLESSPPDIVLADIGMPGRDGYEVARYIRQTPKLSHIPIVLLTGAFEPVDQAKAAEVGCDGVLAKPFEPQLVIGRVKELLAAGPKPAGTASFVPEITPSEPDPVGAPQNLDEYFDRLDTAFANLGGSPAPGAAAPEQATAPVVPEPPAHGLSVSEQIDSFAALHGAQPSSDPELPISYASPAPPVVPIAPPVVATLPAPAAVLAPPLPQPEALSQNRPAQPSAPVSATRSGPRELPSVADAFAAILAAEQSESPLARPVWPASASPSPAPAAPQISGELIDQIVERVLSRLSVGDRVAEVAERLVREEIERIKASIR